MERSEKNDLNVSLARIKGDLDAESKTQALIELREAREHWDNLGK